MGEQQGEQEGVGCAGCAGHWARGPKHAAYCPKFSKDPLILSDSYGATMPDDTIKPMQPTPTPYVELRSRAHCACGATAAVKEKPHVEGCPNHPEEQKLRLAEFVDRTGGRVSRCGECGETPGFYPDCPKCGKRPSPTPFLDSIRKPRCSCGREAHTVVKTWRGRRLEIRYEHDEGTCAWTTGGTSDKPLVTGHGQL